MTIAAGDTFLPKDVPAMPAHLWIVATDPEGEPPSVLLVNLSSYVDDGRRAVDATCLLEPGDHAFVVHTSFVYYEKARIAEISQLQRALDHGAMRPHEPIGKSLLHRIWEGFLRSPDAKPRHQDMVRRFLESG